MSLSVKIASFLLQMINGEAVSYSKIKGREIDAMLADGVLKRRLQGRTQSAVYADDVKQVELYIANNFGVNDLAKYIETVNKKDLTRSEAIAISSDSKLKSIRTFKGFLINSYHPVQAQLNSKPFEVSPASGSYIFISDFENFIIPADVTVVGVENSESFRFIERQKKYFGHINPLFVSRYPQGNDLVSWLKSIPNPYLHFGDFDFWGIKIYLTEYKKHLGHRASFFIPEDIEELLQYFGNSKLYEKQFNRQPDVNDISENSIVSLIEMLHRYKRVLEQEVLIDRS